MFIFFFYMIKMNSNQVNNRLCFKTDSHQICLHTNVINIQQPLSTQGASIDNRNLNQINNSENVFIPNNVASYDIVKFTNGCNSGSISQENCNDNKIWTNFLQRDFQTDYKGQDAKDVYTGLYNDTYINKYYSTKY